MATSPTKNSCVEPTASSALPIMMRMPPHHTARCAPTRRSAIQPPHSDSEIRAGDVETVDRVAGLVVDAETTAFDGADEEQHEDGPHAVVGESLPHLGEEERGESARMAEQLSSGARRDGRRSSVICH